MSLRHLAPPFSEGVFYLRRQKEGSWIATPRLTAGADLLTFCLTSIPLGLALFVPLPKRVHAAGPFTVNNLGNDSDSLPGDSLCENSPGSGVCTLRAAIQEANVFPGWDTINITATGMIVLTNTLPTITGDLTINGPGSGIDYQRCQSISRDAIRRGHRDSFGCYNR